jgi:N-acetylmuramoyl-L-alanine amidase
MEGGTLMGRNLTVALDAGHGGHDSGAVGPNGTRECDVALAVALLTGALMQAAGITVVWTRRTDEFLSLTQRADRANDAQADAFLSIHCNSGPPGKGKGFEIWTTPGETRGDALATSVFLAWNAAFPGGQVRVDISDGDPDKEANYTVIRKTRMAAALAELEFIHTERGEAWLLDKRNQVAAAKALCAGILTYLGVTRKS